MTDKDYNPRLSIEISKRQSDDLRNLIPWGLRRQLFTVIVDDVIRLIRRHGHAFIAAVITGSTTLEDYSSLPLKGGPENADKQSE